MITLDCRGMRCPWPALRLTRALRTGAQALTVLADDPAAAGELQAAAREAGAAVRGAAPRFVVRVTNPIFTPLS